MNIRVRPSCRDQRGMVSIVVVSIIIVVLALITLGFSKIMDRQLRQSLDNSLSQQAYYAAEAGLNDARAYVNSIKDDPTLPSIDPSQCINFNDPQFSSFFVPGGQISRSYTGNKDDNIVKYSCVLINLKPKELVYDVNAGDSAVFKVVPTSLNNLYFSWQNRNYPQNVPKPLQNDCCSLPEENTLGPDATGVLEVTIYPVNSGGYGDNPDLPLAEASRTYFLYPNAGNGRTVDSLDYNNKNDNGGFIRGNCNDGAYPNLPFNQSIQRYCNAEVTGLPSTAAYYVHIVPIYANLSVSIQGSDRNDTAVELPNAEAVVDVTGEGNDVLHRLQARVPYSSSFNYPNYSVDSMQTICKRFRLPKIGPDSYAPAVPVFDSPPGDVNCNLDPGSVFGGGGGGGGSGGGGGGTSGGTVTLDYGITVMSHPQLPTRPGIRIFADGVQVGGDLVFNNLTQKCPRASNGSYYSVSPPFYGSYYDVDEYCQDFPGISISGVKTPSTIALEFINDATGWNTSRPGCQNANVTHNQKCYEDNNIIIHSVTVPGHKVTFVGYTDMAGVPLPPVGSTLPPYNLWMDWTGQALFKVQ